MEQVRCTNCGSTAIIPEEHGEFCRCEACGSTFNVPRAAAFSKVVLDHTQDVRAWREYLAKQLKLQQESSKARDYGGVKLFAQKILSVLPDDFCAQYYVALADRFSDNDVAFVDFLKNASFDGVTPEERKEVGASVVATVEPKYLDGVKEFLRRAYPQTFASFDPILDRNIKSYIQKLRYAKTAERDVFICHRTAEPDQDVADAICTRLEERGLRCWIAPRNILAGSQNYERDILKGVENCRLFLLVSSFKSIYSEDCEMELKAAVLDNKALYSYRIDDTPYDGAFEKALSSVQWLDASDDPYAHLEQLVIDVMGLLAEDEREKAALEEKRLAAREKERMLAEERRSEEQARIERLERIVSGGVAATAAPTYAPRTRLKRAETEIRAGNYKKAQGIIDEALDLDPENPLAWWLLLLCEYGAPDDKKLIEKGADFTSNGYFQNAERFAGNDPVFAARFESIYNIYRNGAVREVNVLLDAAEISLKNENFDELDATLKHCRATFADENSLIFRRFPDVASRYYWLSLWAKYGQSKLVCVEDITREFEYKKALKYASPAQAREYEDARETVSKNAQLFLRERSKHRVNDGKLVDYLVDNRNILPPDVYSHYSSLLYFRQMLKSLNMTEEQLYSSTVDISTNEYFMLAQSIATDEQKREYDALLERLDNNRAGKTAREKAERDREAQRAARDAARKKVSARVAAVFISVFAALNFIFFFAALTGIRHIGYDGGNMFAACLIASGVFRIVCDAFVLKSKNKHLAVLSGFNITLSVVSVMLATGVGIFGMRVTGEAVLDNAPLMVILSITAVILEGIKLNRKRNRGGES